MARNLNIRITENQPFYFLSYNSEDAENPLIKKIVTLLDEYNFPMWYDNGIEKGKKWEEIIAQKISQCSAVIMFLSSNIFTKATSYVKKEFELARDFNNKRIIPVILGDIDKTMVPVQFQTWWIDVTNIQGINITEFDNAETIVKEILNATEFSFKTVSKIATNKHAEKLVKKFRTINSVFTLLDIDYLPSSSNNIFDLCDLVQEFQEAKDSNFLSDDSIINLSTKCIIYGDGGSGKTTFLQHKTFDVASKLLNQPNILPIYIKLSECKENSFVSIQSVLDTAGLQVEQNISIDKLILFLDGLDEFFVDEETKREQLFDDIKNLCNTLDCSVIITCRTKYLPKDNLFKKYKIAPLNIEQITEFIDKYFKFFGINISAEQFLSQLPKDVLEMTKLPLILSMVIALYYTIKKIPSNKDTLYKQIVVQLLEKKPIIPNDTIAIGEKFYLLCRFAFDVLLSGKLSVMYDKAVELIDKNNTFALPSETIIEDFIHSGVLCKNEEFVSFFHASILEYFATQEINKEYSFYAKATMDQYFLRNIEKINRIIRCINPSTDDTIIEVGAGIGSVSLHLTRYSQLVLVDLDEGLCKILHYNFRNKSSVQIIQDDAIKLLNDLNYDKVISNLPFFLTKDVLNCLKYKNFKSAVLSIKIDEDISEFKDVFNIDEICVLNEEDFFPQQPFKSRLVKITKK